MAERRPELRRSTFALREYARPVWRTAGFWQLALASLALLPLLAAAWIWLTPIAPVAPSPAPRPIGPALDLHRLARTPAEAESLALIAGQNLFSPNRQDWAAAVAEAPAATQDDAAKKAAEEALASLTFVGSWRVGPDWRAMFDWTTRRPEQDLLVLMVDDEYEGWRVVSIERDRITVEYAGDTRTLELRPRAALKPAKADEAKKGRSDVAVRPAETRREMFYEPPISLDEATRQLRHMLRDDEQSVRDRLDELLRTLDDET